jgi:hypothetical protein
MPAGLSVALALAAQAVAAPAQAGGSASTAAPVAVAPIKDAPRECTNPPAPDPNSREIVVCAVKPERLSA